MIIKEKIIFLILILFFLSSPIYPQERKLDDKRSPLTCKKEAFTALKPIPRLRYRCKLYNGDDYDERLLKRPQRVEAIKNYIKQLETFTDERWWSTSVKDLNLCYLKKRPGSLTKEQKNDYQIGVYRFQLFGDSQIRLILTEDPCYQKNYNGSNGFILYRKDGTVYVTQVLNGYFSRADNSVDIDFAREGSETIIEISTSSGGLNPTVTNHYFTIEKDTNKAVPKNIFKLGKRLTNTITSDLLLGADDEQDSSSNMIIINKGRLVKKFYTFKVNLSSANDIKKTLYKWNGEFYETLK
jgi:hypothetical protein